MEPIEAHHPSEEPRRSLILAGGGMRVAYQAGVITALFEEGLTFGHADGTSGGTMNLAMMLSGLTPQEMCDRWRTLNVQQFASFMPLEEYLRVWDMMGMASSEGVRKKVFPHLGIDFARIRANKAIQGTFNLCNFSRKISEVIPERELTEDLLVAGISLPVFMPPVRVGPYWYTDSVWIKDANLLEAVRLGSEELWLVWCIGNTPEYKPGAFNQYVHMIEMSANGHLFAEFEQIKEINKGIGNGTSRYGQRVPIRLHVISPRFPLPLDPDLILGHISTGTLIEMGYADAKRYLKREIRSEGLPFTPEATQMQSDGLGIMFSETMVGGLALGPKDPEIGYAQGERDHTIFTMHATIRIPDLHAFVADEQHQGEITGNISYSAFGQQVLCKNGAFKLFSPTEKSVLKLMVYELGFEHGGSDYYLAGRKEIRQASPMHAWKETTTLFTRIHKGSDSNGPIVGAGILSLNAQDLVRLLKTIHVMNANNLNEKLQATSAFGKFFLGELWNSFAHHTDPHAQAASR